MKPVKRETAMMDHSTPTRTPSLLLWFPLLCLICGVVVLSSVNDSRVLKEAIAEVEEKETFSAERFRNEFLNLGLPVVVRGYASEHVSSGQWTLKALQRRFQDPAWLFRQGPGPYPKHERPFLWHDDDGDKDDDNIARNNTLSVFQFGTVPATFALGLDAAECLPVFALKYIHTAYMHDDPAMACELLKGVQVPEFVRRLAPLVPVGGLIAGSMGVATVRHRHEAALNILLEGEKRWKMWRQSDDRLLEIEFTQKVGDVVFIPADMEHEVVNAKPSVAWTFQFHENHFGTSVGRAETQSIIDGYLKQSKREGALR